MLTLTDFYHFFSIYSQMPFVIYIFSIRDSYSVSHLPYAIISDSIFIYAFYSLFSGLSLAHIYIIVTFNSVIYALYCLLGLSLAHICISFDVCIPIRFIYAFHSL